MIRLLAVLVAVGAGIVIILGLIGVGLPGRLGAAAPAFNGALLDPPLELAAFTLEQAEGKRFVPADTRGRVSLFFFGYTSCPDVCPMTLANLATVRKQLGDHARYVDVYFVTVDPDRDTPARIADYAARFDPAIIPLSGSLEELARVRSAFGVVAARREAPDSQAGYFMDHSAGIYLVDPTGHLRLVESHTTPAADIMADVKRVLATTTVPLAIGFQRPATGGPQGNQIAAGRAKSADGSLVLQRAWARAASDDLGAAGGNSAAYLVIRNLGPEDEWLLAARSDAATAVEIHQSHSDGHVVQMSQATSPLQVPARGEITLDPGETHLMLIGLRRDLEEGSELTLTLQFARAGEVELKLPATSVCPP